MTGPPPVPPSRTLTVMLVAGEPSGDAIGGRLMAALKLRTLGRVQFIGVGGERMLEQGLQSLFPMTELSIMGLVEVLPRIPRLWRRIRETAELAEMRQPDALVTIDAPAFAFRLARRLSGRGIPLVHYVAPQVWAWRPGRAREIVSLLDHLLVMLPFEVPWFEQHGLSTQFVGHPVIESGADRGDGRAFRARHGVDPARPLLCVLPGSRMGEVRRHLPVFGEAVARLKQRFPDLGVVVPTVGGVAGAVAGAVSRWPVPVVVVGDASEKFDAMAACDAGLAASGTVSLELALAKVPMVTAYRVNPLTGFMARHMIKVRHVNLVNLILDRPVVAELLQQDCTAENLAEAVVRVMKDPAIRAGQTQAVQEVAMALGHGGELPSLRAADAVLRAIELGPRRRGPAA